MPDSQNVILNNIDISNMIFSDEVNNKVSIYAGIQSVRENLVMKQQLIAENSDIVMVGRDIDERKAKINLFARFL